MWVGQSQAPAGTAKFTGVEGCDALGETSRACMVTPAAMEASRILRRVSMRRYLACCTDAAFRPEMDPALSAPVDREQPDRLCVVAQAGLSQLSHRWRAALRQPVRTAAAIRQGATRGRAVRQARLRAWPDCGPAGCHPHNARPMR